MTIKKSTLKNIALATSAIFFGVALLVFLTSNKPISGGVNNQNSTANTNTTTAQIVDGKQIAEITANFNGYQPAVLELKAGIPTTLKVTSVNNFGCGSALRVPKLGISANLPINGVNEIDLGTQSSGTTLDVMCSMGMYRMKLKFV